MSSATRHCLLTGLYPVRSGAYPNHTRLNDGVGTPPQYLKQAGYRVALEGKRHIAPIEAFPFEYLSNEQQRTVLSRTDRTVSGRRGRSGEPFFLYVGSTEPPRPLEQRRPEPLESDDLTLPCNLVDTPATRKQFRNYLAEINELDNQVGAVDALLHKYGPRRKHDLHLHQRTRLFVPFGKWTCYDEGLHTGFVIRWPGTVKPGRVTDAMCEYVDVTPTLVDIAGGKIPEGLDGRSFLPVIKGETDSFKNRGIRHPDQLRNLLRTGVLRHPFDSQRTLRLHHEPHARGHIQMGYVHESQERGWWMSWKEKAATDESRPATGRTLSETAGPKSSTTS